MPSSRRKSPPRYDEQDVSDSNSSDGHQNIQQRPPLTLPFQGTSGGSDPNTARPTSTSPPVSPTSAIPVISTVNAANYSAPKPTNPNPFLTAASAPQAFPGSSPVPPGLSPAVSQDDDMGVLNFARRPSTVDPLHNGQRSPSFTSPRKAPPVPGQSAQSNPAHAGAAQAAAAAQAAKAAKERALGAGKGGQIGGHVRRKSSHTRHPSVSLIGGETNRDTGKILPLQPAPTRTRAPMEAFASVDMLQGQREHQDRTRGQEIFGRDGKYEGRASVSGASPEQQFWNKRQDPTEALRLARAGQRHPSSQALSPLPPIDVDIANIANQLREYDARRGSEDRLGLWRQSDDEEIDHHSPTSADYSVNPTFSFPNRQQSSNSETDLADIGELVDNGSPYSEKSLFGDNRGDRHGWRTEPLGAGSEKALQMQRPSIVALPVYPSPNSNGRAAKSHRFKKVLRALSWLTVLVANAATGVYLGKRAEAVILVERKMPAVFVGAWCFLVLEIIVAVFVAISSMYQVFTYRNTVLDPKMRLRGDANLPAVDIFVVAGAGTDEQEVFDCAAAAASVDYPPHRYRVMVLDPTCSSELRNRITDHAKSKACPHLSYHPSPPAQTTGTAVAKLSSRASLINFGITEASSFGVKGPAEYIAVLDAEMIPERNYLRAILPSILGDGKVALVKSRHGYMNLPARLGQSQAIVMHAADAPSDCRSGFLLRRAALVEIGGFPSDSWIQDGHCEALLLGRGYRVNSVDEILQWTTASAGFLGQIDSMMVNRLGPLRTAWRLRFFAGQATKEMPFGARLKALARGFSPLLSLFALLLATVYPFMFSLGGILVLSPNLDNLNALLQLTLLAIILQRLHDLVWCYSTGQPSPRRDFQSWVFGAAYSGFALIRLALPRRLGGYPAGGHAVRHNPNPVWWKRLGLLVIDPNSGVVLAFGSAFGVAIWRIVKDYERGTVDRHQTALTALLTVAWPSLLWFEFLSAAIVSIPAILAPPPQAREAFLVRDHYTLVARPKQHCRTAAPFKVRRRGELALGFLQIGWAIAACCLGMYSDVYV